MDKKVRKAYRIREDIVLELEGLVRISNRDILPGDKVITETYLLEDALVMYINCVKQMRRGQASLDAKCCQGDK